jgi:hypothetical protein
MRRLQNNLPYESGYTEHREIERRRRETREWLRQREAHADALPALRADRREPGLPGAPSV